MLLVVQRECELKKFKQDKEKHLAKEVMIRKRGWSTMPMLLSAHRRLQQKKVGLAGSHIGCTSENRYYNQKRCDSKVVM